MSGLKIAGSIVILLAVSASVVLLFLPSPRAPQPELAWSYTTSDRVWSVGISSDGSHVVAGGYDGKVYLFSQSSDVPLWSHTIAGVVQSVSISSDGSYLAAGGGLGASAAGPGVVTNKVYFFSKSDNTPL
jgi:WD40 repeat protein